MEYNVGNAFNKNTGKFTCPHDGIYSFYATAHVGNSRAYGDFFIYVNGRSKVLHYSSEYDNISPHGVFKLKKGDTVHMRMKGLFYSGHSQCARTYFEGHLIDLL